MNAGQPEVDIGEAAAGVMPDLGDPNSAWGVAGQEEVGPSVIIVVAPSDRSTDHPRQRDIETVESGPRVAPYFGYLADSCLASQQNVQPAVEVIISPRDRPAG